jgi:hypothetical protein
MTPPAVVRQWSFAELSERRRTVRENLLIRRML